MTGWIVAGVVMVIAGIVIYYSRKNETPVRPVETTQRTLQQDLTRQHKERHHSRQEWCRFLKKMKRVQWSTMQMIGMVARIESIVLIIKKLTDPGELIFFECLASAIVMQEVFRHIDCGMTVTTRTFAGIRRSTR